MPHNIWLKLASGGTVKRVLAAIPAVTGVDNDPPVSTSPATVTV
ncbi:MAG: hypothetical protein R2873_08250 [Caldilineaceae bacterium]